MTTLPDLSPCIYVSASPEVLAVGWLGAGARYPVGPVDEAVFAKLMQLLVEPWNPVKSMGFHACELCRFTGGSTRVDYRTAAGQDLQVQIGNRNLFVPSGGKLYVAPSSIVHYIDAHGYAPPAVFCAAVLACPPMGSMEYRMALLRSPPEFVAAYVKRPR